MSQNHKVKSLRKKRLATGSLLSVFSPLQFPTSGQQFSCTKHREYSKPYYVLKPPICSTDRGKHPHLLQTALKFGNRFIFLTTVHFIRRIMFMFMVCLLTLLQQMTRVRWVHRSLAQESDLLPSHLSVSTRPATSARTMVGRARLPVEPAWPATGRAADRLSMSPGTLWVLDGLMLSVILMYEWIVKLCVKGTKKPQNSRTVCWQGWQYIAIFSRRRQKLTIVWEHGIIFGLDSGCASHCETGSRMALVMVNQRQPAIKFWQCQKIGMTMSQCVCSGNLHQWTRNVWN